MRRDFEPRIVRALIGGDARRVAQRFDDRARGLIPDLVAADHRDRLWRLKQ